LNNCLALKNRVALKLFIVLKYFLSFRTFEQLVLALKKRVCPEFTVLCIVTAQTVKVKTRELGVSQLLKQSDWAQIQDFK